MRRLVMVFATLSAAAVLGACGDAQVIAQAQLESETAEEATPISDLPIQLIPFDRDEVFDSLSQAYGQPEPAIPDSLLALQEDIAEAQEEWQEAEVRWNEVRDRLRALSDTLNAMNRGQARYRVLFREFQDLESQVMGLQRQSEQAFARFSALQTRFTEESQAIQLARQEWGDEAFAGVNEVFEARLEALDREIHVDTTNAQGVARFEVPPGQWWIHARYELPYSELYWNVPVEVERGDPVQVRLNRSNALDRPKL